MQKSEIAGVSLPLEEVESGVLCKLASRHEKRFIADPL